MAFASYGRGCESRPHPFFQYVICMRVNFFPHKVELSDFRLSTLLPHHRFCLCCKQLLL